MTYLSRLSSNLILRDDLDKDQLASSLLCMNGMKLLAFAEDNNAIPLTKSGMFYRKFVVWAVEEFKWPGHDPDILYAVNKVLNEEDFTPLNIMHELLLSGQLLKHIKGDAVLTETGRQVLGNHGVFQALMFETYFTDFDFSAHERFPIEIEEADYRHFLGVIGNRLDSWTAFDVLAEWCLPIYAFTQWRISPLSDACLYLMSNLVRPLNWLGLLEEAPRRGPIPLEQRRFRKTELFDQFLFFDTSKLGTASIH